MKIYLKSRFGTKTETTRENALEYVKSYCSRLSQGLFLRGRILENANRRIEGVQFTEEEVYDYVLTPQEEIERDLFLKRILCKNS